MICRSKEEVQELVADYLSVAVEGVDYTFFENTVAPDGRIVEVDAGSVTPAPGTDPSSETTVATKKATITPASKTVKAKKLKKKAKTFTFTVKDSDGAVSAQKASSAKLNKRMNVKVSKNKVKVTLKKGAKKGTYKVKISVAESGEYLATSKTVKIKVR